MATVEHTVDLESQPLVSLTPTAATKIKELMAEEPDAGSLVLRVAIQGGGCSGFQYGLGFDTGSAEGDLEYDLEGVRVVVGSTVSGSEHNRKTLEGVVTQTAGRPLTYQARSFVLASGGFASGAGESPSRSSRAATNASIGFLTQAAFGPPTGGAAFTGALSDQCRS